MRPLKGARPPKHSAHTYRHKLFASHCRHISCKNQVMKLVANHVFRQTLLNPHMQDCTRRLQRWNGSSVQSNFVNDLSKDRIVQYRLSPSFTWAWRWGRPMNFVNERKDTVYQLTKILNSENFFKSIKQRKILNSEHAGPKAILYQR